MRKLYFLIIIVFIFASVPQIDASHKDNSKRCSIGLSAYVFPIYYKDEMRGNPNNTFYPGDGFHYLFSFSGSLTCGGFGAQSITSEGAFELLSHDIITNYTSSMKKHSHNDLDLTPKYLTTTHYYVDRVSYENCKQGRCSVVIPAQNPAFSIREDKPPSYRLAKILQAAKTASTFNLRSVQTQNWDFGTVGTSHTHSEGHVFESDESIKEFDDTITRLCSNLMTNQGCVFGHAEIDPKIITKKCLFEELDKSEIKYDITLETDKCVDVTGHISLAVKGTKVTCNHKECKASTVQRVAEIKKIILEPSLDVILSKPAMPDTSGYDAKNLDGTYYPHDPLNVTVLPEFRFKDQRAQTIQFNVTKTFDLKNMFDYTCTESSCVIPIDTPGVKPHLLSLGNGDGLSIFNATLNQLGVHDFEYTVDVFNLGQKINSASSTTDALVVDYDPVFKSYPYARIADDNRYSFDDRQAVALHYFGSYSSGGPDDKKGIHQERRSKINDFHHAGFAFDPWMPFLIKQDFLWSKAIDAGIISEVIPQGLDVIFAKDENSEIIPLESHFNDAMFVRSGYGKIFFEYPLSSIIFDADTSAPRYENATSFVTLLSNNFAGKQNTFLTFWEFMVPETSFVTNLTVKTINQNNTLTNHPIHVSATPQFDNGAVYLTNYLNQKITFDSSDAGLAKVIINDTYPMTFDYSSNGLIHEKLRRISSQFQDFEGVSYDTSSESTGIFKQSEEYLKDSQRLRLEIPLGVGLTAPSPTDITITANGITHIIDARFIDFDTDKEILINLQDDNVLHVDRGLGHLIIFHDENFGAIVKILVNDVIVNADCLVGCTIPVNATAPLYVTVYNQWGGTSHVSLPEFITTLNTPISSNLLNPLLGLLGLLVASYILYVKLHKNHDS